MLREDQLRSLPHSETLLINETSERLAQQRPVVRFGFGQSPFPVPERLHGALARHAHQKAYAPVQGLPELRAAVAAFHRKEDGVDWQPERVLIGPGSKLLIYTVLAAVRRATVMLTGPSWVSYEPQAILAGHPVTRLPTRAAEQWRLQPDTLDAACREARLEGDDPCVLIINSPNNPSGTSYGAADLQALASVARRHNLIVISDEIYGRLHHTGEHQSFARFYPEGTLVTGGLSKWAGAGGWRLGILHIPEALDAVLKPSLLGIASETWSCVATPIQMAAVEAYGRHPDIEAYVDRQRRVLHTIGQQSADRLRSCHIATAEPEGGFYLFPDFEYWRADLADRGIATAAELCDRLLAEAGVALLPASAFGMPQDFLGARLSYVNFDGSLALDENADMDSATAPVRQGIQLIDNWLQKKVRLSAVSHQIGL
ncbi:MAG: aminotransferase class I/II-fold pyridoxal phosphate-dependent enzyme [Natronospirillum sp.]|uniref:pyridoxal phosphate-dependent aminotransferase n=1 Tax=Natronospirillum sp. TaxID=2812955 RepID=UPI0025E9EED1|nr:aminotransferase class I/II-fold pyridoxal phosphate-dependent enzyme [Natronospirillum sp.]MCH8551153.1 aminotransferase class I/II-fold pyridoxal phosphate-dependent enzyme [Natronospirillum sp.]